MFYEYPFNPDAITPGSYEGIAQIDPIWMSPQFDASAIQDPSAINFYEPTWWYVQGIGKIHHSHLIIFRGDEVPDMSKPSYNYGGVSLVQKIYERVYAAERTANEAPILAMTKRLIWRKMDLTKIVNDPEGFQKIMALQDRFRDNHGTMFLGAEEDINQIDTSLADMDALIMTQYQLVAAIANMPATKLLGTVPKGFNSTGSYEESSYHEELETIQQDKYSDLVDRHHLCVIRSYLPASEWFEPGVSWNALDAMTAKEAAEVNKLKAETDQTWLDAGALDGQDVRSRIAADEDSGYTGINPEVPEMEEEPVETQEDPVNDPKADTDEA